MKKLEAISLLQNCFDAEYSATAFAQFISNLFKGEYTNLDKRRDCENIREAFRAYVQEYRILGTYQDAEGLSLDVLEVTLQRDSSLDRARTAQRNFVADYLKESGRDAALVSFLSTDQHDWRFSLVKLEYSLEVKDGKLKTEEVLTPAKRWSFLIGRHEGSHTVQSRVVSLLQDINKPLLSELEEAFNIESVTDEFFKKYCELFFRMKESLDKLIETDANIKIDFESKEITTVDFAKKTLGQMAFLYFLQKKGWFGVAPEKPWGTGPKDFLRQLFNRRDRYGENFFDDVLEPLFYEALAQDRGIEAIYPRLNNCRMPFLNGGLFEPMNGYSWETTHILLPDDLFSNANMTPEGDEGDGILDIFDRYNFTVNESEPLEKEVAVDPEMLGKVFENLLEVKDRKSKGTFYTPREIVHYMCQESLINYLCSETKQRLLREDLETLIRNGSQILQNDAIVFEKGLEGDYHFMLPEGVRSMAHELDKLLADIKICDPAVGSGAFPLGMLNEIIQARQALAVYLGSTKSVFALKLHSISHSIFGVDIDPGAVEIAKLRLWLALVVEEDEPHPLPNLEHKIMQGNSLISEYEGVKLFDDSVLENANNLERERVVIEQKVSELQREYFSLHSNGKLKPTKKIEIERELGLLSRRKKALVVPNIIETQELNIFDVNPSIKETQKKTEKLKHCIEMFVSESSKSKKQALKIEIESLKWELIEASLREQDNLDKLEELKRLRNKNVRPFFIWKLEFSDVFISNGGFDVVIGNPPYGQLMVDYYEQTTVSVRSVMKSIKDIYKAFFYSTITDVLKKEGVLSFITPNTFLMQDQYKDLREFILKRTLSTVLDLGDGIFENAVVPTAITVIQNRSALDDSTTKMKDLRALEKFEAHSNLVNLPQKVFLETAGFFISPNMRESSEREIALGEILNCRDAGVQYASPKIGVANKGATKISERLLYKLKDGKLLEDTRDFPLIEGKNLNRYHFDKNSIDSYLRYNYDDLIDKKKKEWVHFTKFIFDAEERLIWRQTSDSLCAAYDTSKCFFKKSVHGGVIQPDYVGKVSLKFILSIFNSKTLNQIYQKNTQESGRVFAQVKIGKVKNLPIRLLPLSEQEPFVSVVDQILELTSKENYSPQNPPSMQIELENKLNEMVAELYAN